MEVIRKGNVKSISFLDTGEIILEEIGGDPQFIVDPVYSYIVKHGFVTPGKVFKLIRACLEGLVQPSTSPEGKKIFPILFKMFKRMRMSGHKQAGLAGLEKWGNKLLLDFL